ncbi:hypothetical protein F8M41_023857 [Gigaspora margarita]|uniref:Uncharacterized protein n=1 Tax=Gigaspora margarita TaxID=4874 RepID=A0A8H4ET85_GIGMA|nr:hypothetical protein F8M41_023857 [Gigaspora margarita]
MMSQLSVVPEFLKIPLPFISSTELLDRKVNKEISELHFETGPTRAITTEAKFLLETPVTCNENIIDIKSVKLLTQNDNMQCIIAEFDIGTTLSQITIALNAGEHIYDKFKVPLYDMHLSDFLENIQPEFSLLFYSIEQPYALSQYMVSIKPQSLDELKTIKLQYLDLYVNDYNDFRLGITISNFRIKASVIEVSNATIDFEHHDSQWTGKIKSVAKIIRKDE